MKKKISIDGAQNVEVSKPIPCEKSPQEQLAIMLGRTAGKASAPGMVIICLTGRQCQWQILPVHHIVTDCMSPVDIAPESLIWIALIEKVVFSLFVIVTVKLQFGYHVIDYKFILLIG